MGKIRVGVIRPNELIGIYAWYDANEFFSLSAGTQISTWTDKSGNGFNLNWENYNSQPNKSTKQIGPNGYSILSGAGVYKTSGMTMGANQPITFFNVYKANNINNAVFGTPQDATLFGLIIGTTVTRVFYGSAGNVVNTGDTTNYHQMTTVVSTSSTQRVLRYDRNNIIVTANNNNTITDLWLNTRPVGFGGNGSNNHCEIIIYNRALSLQEIGQIEKYLKFKWLL